MNSYTLEIFMYIRIYTSIYVFFFIGSREVVYVLLWMDIILIHLNIYYIYPILLKYTNTDIHL